jgi:hypothetical protein
MNMRLIFFFAGLLFLSNSIAQQHEPQEFLFREDWSELAPFDGTTPYSMTQNDVLNPDLLLTLYGSAKDSIRKRHHGTATDAYYVYTGFCPSTWALALSNNKFYVDLGGNAVIRCRVRNSGSRELHIIVQVDNGNWFISDQAVGSSSVWKVHDFVIKDIKWSHLNINKVTPGEAVDHPELIYGSHWLGQVDKIGFTDLMNGGLSAACSRIDWIEVYANPARR